jgi:hypothetical protein
VLVLTLNMGVSSLDSAEPDPLHPCCGVVHSLLRP